MKKLSAFLSVLLVALVSGAWVIKDTANPVDIYSGSNTTPSISAATSGAVTVGPVSSTQTHTINGLVSQTFNANSSSGTTVTNTSTGGSAFTKMSLVSDTSIFSIQESSAASSSFAQVTTNNPNGILFRASNGTGAFRFDTGGANNRGGIDSAGNWTMGQANGTNSLTLNGTALNLNGGSQVSTAVFFAKTGTTSSDWRLGTNEGGPGGAGGFFLYTGTGATNYVGGVSTAGAWTFGASGGTQTHTINGTGTFTNGIKPSAASDAIPKYLQWSVVTPTFANAGTVSTVQFTAHQIGDTYESRGHFTTGATTAATCALIMPGVTINNTKLFNNAVVGRWFRLNSTNVYTAGNDGVLFFDGSATDRVFFSFIKNTANFVQQNCATIFGSNEKVEIEYSIPIN